MTDFTALPITTCQPHEDVGEAAQRAFGDHAGVTWLSSAMALPMHYEWIGVVHVPDTGVDFAVYREPI